MTRNSGKRAVFTSEQIAKMRKLAADGVPTAAIAERFGVSRPHVAKLVRMEATGVARVVQLIADRDQLRARVAELEDEAHRQVNNEIGDGAEIVKLRAKLATTVEALDTVNSLLQAAALRAVGAALAKIRGGA